MRRLSFGYANYMYGKHNLGSTKYKMLLHHDYLYGKYTHMAKKYVVIDSEVLIFVVHGMSIFVNVKV